VIRRRSDWWDSRSASIEGVLPICHYQTITGSSEDRYAISISRPLIVGSNGATNGYDATLATPPCVGARRADYSSVLRTRRLTPSHEPGWPGTLTLGGSGGRGRECNYPSFPALDTHLSERDKVKEEWGNCCSLRRR
jgi:hypothetical protein